MRHSWSFVCSRPTLDSMTVIATYQCRRCSSSYDMEVLRSQERKQAAHDPPSWKNVGLDCDVVIVAEVMTD